MRFFVYRLGYNLIFIARHSSVLSLERETERKRKRKRERGWTIGPPVSETDTVSCGVLGWGQDLECRVEVRVEGI